MKPSLLHLIQIGTHCSRFTRKNATVQHETITRAVHMVMVKPRPRKTLLPLLFCQWCLGGLRTVCKTKVPKLLLGQTSASVSAGCSMWPGFPSSGLLKCMSKGAEANLFKDYGPRRSDWHAILDQRMSSEISQCSSYSIFRTRAWLGPRCDMRTDDNRNASKQSK